MLPSSGDDSVPLGPIGGPVTGISAFYQTQSWNRIITWKRQQSQLSKRDVLFENVRYFVRIL
jgi:hypothetical protein